MKKLYKIIFLFLVVFLNFNKIVFANVDSQNVSKENYWKSFNFSAIYGLGINPWVMGGNYIGHWGFVDENLDKELFGGYQCGFGAGFRPSKYFEIFNNLLKGEYTVSIIGGLGINPWVMGGNYIGHWGFVDENLDKELFGGYQCGFGAGFRPSKYFEIFINLLKGEYKVLLGKWGDQLYGPAIFDASNGQFHPYSPPLPLDIYYTSKVYLSQIGVRGIYPITKFIEPYTGLGINMCEYECAFSNKDASIAYSEILSGANFGLNLTFGVNFKIIRNNEIFWKFGPYFEIGHIVTDSEEMHDWLWVGCTYRNQFLITTYYRFGIIIGYVSIDEN
jgi:hypothetical protein